MSRITADNFEEYVFATGDVSRAQWDFTSADYDSGTIKTDHGIVRAYAHGDDDKSGYTQLRIVKDGEGYERRWGKRYSRRFMVTLARRFAADLFEQSEE